MATAREVAEQMRKKKQEQQQKSNDARSTAEMIRKYNSLPTNDVNESYIKTFVSDANRFFSTSEDDNDAYTKWKDLSIRSETISAWLYKNRGNLDSKTYDSISSAVKTFGDATKGYSQFSSEDDYMRAVSGWLNNEAPTNEKTVAARQEYYDKNASRAKEIDENLPWYVNGVTPNFIEDLFLSDEEEGRRDEMERLIAENKRYTRGQGTIDKYYQPETSKFKQSAANRTHKNATKEELWNYDMSVMAGSTALNNGGYFDDDGNIRNSKGEIVMQANTPLVTDKLGMFLSASDDDIAEGYNRLMATNGNYTDTWANLMQEGDVNAWRELTDYELSLYYYYLNTEGQKKAYEFLEAMTTELTRRETQKRTEAINDASVPAQIALNIASIPMNVVGGAVGLIDNAANIVQGKDINPYSRAHSFSNAAGAIREDTAKDIDTATGGAAIPWLDFTLGDAYQAGMSFADSALAALVPYGIGEVLLASGAATSEMKELYERGATTGQMLTGGTLAFAAEAVFEHFSIGELKKIKNMDEKAVKNLFDGFTRSLIMGSVEASEEMATEIANTISDALVMGSQSDWVDFETFTKNVLNAGLGGFLSGGVGGGVASTVNNAQYQKYVKEYGQSIIDQDGVENLQTQASEIIGDKSVSKLSQKVATKPSAKNVGRLATKIQSITSAKNKSEVAAKLEEKGLSRKEAQKVSNFVEKVSEGYEATAEETAEIEKITDKLPDVIPKDEGTAQAVQTPEERNAEIAETKQTTENVPETESATESVLEASEDIDEEERPVSLEDASKKYGAQAGAMVHTYIERQDVAKYDAAYQIAYDMGKSGVSLSYAMNSKSTAYLTESQRKIAYETGANASDSEAAARDAENKKAANGKTGRRIGAVKGEGVTISDLKKTFNDTQNTAYKLLSTYAEATGIDIVLFKSEANADGQFEGAQGRFKWKDNTIYIDINAGLNNTDSVLDLAQYTMLRTFSHEFTHFLEKWNPVRYNEFRKVVFDTLTERGEDVDVLIAEKLNQDASGKMTYDEASREIIAEAMTDILPDANFVQELAENHKNIFGKLLEKLKEFLADLKAYFSTLEGNSPRQANALKEQVGDAVHYVESIVKLFDKIAVEAVEIYQKAVATEVETTETAGKTTDHYDHFSITDNAEFGTLEITFDGKPPQAVRDAMKDKKFRWHKVKGVWYGKGDRAEIATAIQNAYAAEEKADTEVTENAEQRTEKEIPNDGRTETSLSENQGGRRYEDENGSGIQGSLGEKTEKSQEVPVRERYGIISYEHPFGDKAYVTPEEGSYLQKAQLESYNDYGIPCYVVNKDAWTRKALATTLNKTIFVSESIDEDTLNTFVAHESTHAIKNYGFMPYIDFIETTSDSLNFASESTRKLTDLVKEHIAKKLSKKEATDITDMTDEDGFIFYDELNAFVYGLSKGGIIGNEDFDYDWVKDAFHDFSSYITELSDIHEQFKKANKPASDFETAFRNASQEERAEVVEAINEDTNISHVAETEIRDEDNVSTDVDTAQSDHVEAETDTRTIEEREKAYKKKFSQWLKKAAKQCVFHYGGESFLSDAVLGIRATDDEIGWAKIEFSGMITEIDMPKPGADALDNANTLITEAPIEGTIGDTSVYAFNIDGKQQVFDKKLLSKLDGNLFYIGDFVRGFKIIKAVDTDGNVAGFLLPLKTTQEITNTKPSKLKSFSSKFLSQITKQEVNQNVENADNQAAVSRTHADRQGDSRVLDEVETGDVSRDAQRGDTLDDAVQRERETARDDHSDDAGRSERGHGEGSGESADLRRDDGLTPEEASQKAEQLHEEVKEQIEQQSTETPKGRNFVIGDSLSLPNGDKARYKVNVAAIRLVKKLEAEGRYATEFEQQLLSKYVGWGGLANVFDERKADWSAEYKELKELLTDEEYAAARGSTLNAHYTDISVIKAMYDGLAKLGFDGGRMLEPSSGVGNFVGAMPAEMSAKVKSWTMVELDNITGLIAKYLYPNADVRIQGFEKANIPNNFMDVAISNVPFGKFPITDKAYPKKVTSSIHNYFFAKTLDKVRPGGIVMFITSSYTMNSKDTTVRRYIMQRADLLGAIRLPDTAFKGNAGTEVVTDILILKKRAANTPYAGENFLEAPYSYPVKGNYYGANINDYFTEHPEMVLGTPSMDGGMYRGGSLTYKALEGKGSLADQIREAFTHINGKMDYTASISPEKTNFAVERASKKTKQNGFVSREGKIFQNQDGSLVPVEVNAKVAERITGMLEIRDAAKNLLNHQQQGLKESEIKKARQTLNKLYDAYVKKYGFLNAPANKKAFKEDPDCYSLFALENWDNEKKKATKADIFAKNTVTPNRTVTSAKDVPEGLIVSVNQTGGVDVALIARLTGKAEDDVRRELIDSRLAYKNRSGALETAESYLSGNVRAKLRDAEAMAPMDADYQKNVEALKAIVPKDVSYQEIAVQPGTPWIPNSVYSDFAAYMLGGRNTEWRTDVDVTRNPETGNFTVELKGGHLKHSANNTQRWGTPRRSFLDLFDSMLNSKSVVVKIKLEDGTSIVDKDATAAANEKIENITKEFSEWLWKDDARRTELTELYNEVFNSIVTPKYNGDNLTVNGANANKPLRPHQRDAVQRVISSGGNTLLAHKVGAGKTYEMAAAAMKLKELGLVKKPMFAVPKSLVAQWGNEFIDFFPTAKLLVADETDFTAANRKTFMNRIANGDYDAVIVSYEQFERLPMSDDFTRELYQEQIDSVIAAIEEAKAEKGDKALSVKDLEKKRKSLQAKIDKLSDSAKDEGNIDFEELGVDSLFIDEAHNFKNLFYTTSMTNVSGLGNKDGAKRSFDLYTKVRYLQKLNGGRGIVFATATPVMNSMSEMYIMQKYLQPDVLNQLGLSTFDAWAKQFGEVVNGVEIKPSGQGYRIKQSFSRFKNMSELQLLFRNFADVLTDVPGLKIPKMKGGKVNVVVCEPGQFQKDYMKELEKRADNVKNVDPSVDNMLKITSDGRKISYTQRMIDPSLPYEEGCKIYRCADNVVKAYEGSADIKGTQLVFCDMATPKGKSKTETSDADTDSGMDMESARLYDDIKMRLIEGGIPAKEIAFIHEADTDQKKKKLFADVNEGKVRVLIGSTGKMGVGMNAQKRIVAIHHLDAPWRPGDVEQRNGRAYRQGNINEEVECFTYVTEGSFDARLWDILERKQNFINQIMNGENIGRETEDTGEVTLSAAEVKALASGSPLIMEQVQLDTDIKKLESLQRAHRSAIRSAAERLETDKGTIDILKRKIASGKADMASTVDTYSEGKFAINIGKQKLTDKKEAGAALVVEATAKATVQGYTAIGTFAGFEMRVIKTDEGIKGMLQGKQSYPFNVYPGNATFGITHLINVVESISESVNKWNAQLKATEDDLAEQEKLMNEPFAKQAELDKKRLRFKEVMDILNPKEEQSAASLDDENVQEQTSKHLGKEQHQQRTNTLTDREVLELAAKAIRLSELTEAEQNALGIFEERLDKLKKLQEERAEQGRLYKDQQFGVKVDRNAAAETLNRMKVLDDQIKRATADVLTVEEKEVLKRVLQKARKVVETQERQHGKELLDRYRERRQNAAAIKKYRNRLRGDVDELSNWILHPNNKDTLKHVPDVLKNSVIHFLSSINFMSKRSLKGGEATIADKKFIENTKSLNAALKINIDVYGMYSGYNDLPPNFMERLQTFIDSALSLVNKSEGEFIINKMTSEELKELSQIVRTLKKYIMQINRFHNNAMYQHVYEAGDDSIQFLGELDNAGSHAGKVSNFVLWQQMRPAYAFERFGKGGIAIYDELRRGQAKLAFNTKEIQSFAEKAYSAKEVKAWEEEIKEFSLGGDLVKIPVSGIMSLYELSKDPEALVHINGGGIRVATYTHKGKKISDTGHIIIPGDLQTILSSLTQRQMEVADSLQKYMATQGAKWGNYVSVARFGEELFTKEHYFPINSDGRHLQATAEEHPSATALYALLNMSFTKSRKEGANNRIVIYSIFDVFANHMASMAQYNAMALPILDALKWFNYRQIDVDQNGNKTILGSVRDQMARVYGVPEETSPESSKQGYAETFVANIIKAFNGTEAQGTPYDTFGLKSLHRYNMAQVAYNLRVVVQQPLAITRAALLMDYGSIRKGLKLKPATVKNNIEEMQKYSGIAAWKALGFYDVNISRGLTYLIKHDETWRDKVDEIGMLGAEKADLWAWASMWAAAKEEVIKKQYLTPESEGFYEAVTKLFEDVIYKTQVVDSVLTKNEFMRDKGFFARAIGSFMSEPTTTASMVIDAFDKFYLDIKRGLTRQQAWQKNKGKIGRMLYVYGVSAVLLAAVQAVADAFRDDDEYESYGEKWVEAFIGNVIDELMPFNKLPIVKEIYEIGKELLSAGGWDTYGQVSNLPYAEIAANLVKGVEIIYDKITGEDTNYTRWGGISKLLQAVSGITGLAMASATREIITVWNNIVGAMAPSLKVKTYEPSELAQIRYAFEDGYLSEEEATELLLEKGLADTENEAYFIIQGWEAGEGYSRYDAIYDAVRSGGDLDAAMEELLSHGYTEEELISKIQSKIGEWYKSGEITKQEAIAMLQKHTSMNSDAITKAVNKWSCVVVTGIEYDEIADEFMAGNITASRAIDMYTRYGGMTREKALEKVDVLQFVKQNPSCEDITATAVADYREYCEGVGLDPTVYYEAWKYKNSLSGAVKEQTLAYIHSLSLNAKQKDSLYFAFGWAKSKLYEAPWH